MRRELFERWLRKYKDAWESRDPEAAVAIFTDDATYQENPFHDPMRGSSEIRDYWVANTNVQEDVNFNFEIIATDGDVAVNHWRVSFVSTDKSGSDVNLGGPVEIDGIFKFRLDSDGLCPEFREWWHVRQSQ
jgi:ketosteroid isomerase-like protein